MFRFIHLIVGFGLIMGAQTGFSQAKNQPLTGQSFSGKVSIQADPGRVWEVLTDTEKLTEILGYRYVSGTKKFSSIGDHARVNVWGDAGSFMLVHADHAKELRFNLDPENGSYICSCRWILTPSGEGTTVMYQERYTESSPQSPEELAAQVKDTNNKFHKLKQLAEYK